MFKVNYRDIYYNGEFIQTKTLNLFHASFSVSIVDLEQGNVCWVYILSLTSETSVNNMVVIQFFP